MTEYENSTPPALVNTVFPQCLVRIWCSNEAGHNTYDKTHSAQGIMRHKVMWCQVSNKTTFYNGRYNLRLKLNRKKLVSSF
jgi:hypothetical protein